MILILQLTEMIINEPESWHSHSGASLNEDYGDCEPEYQT